jgi:hypothetical protein
MLQNKLVTRIFETKRTEVAAGWRKLHNEERHKFIPQETLLMSRDSSVGIATGYGLDDRMIGV